MKRIGSVGEELGMGGGRKEGGGGIPEEEAGKNGEGGWRREGEGRRKSDNVDSKSA